MAVGRINAGKAGSLLALVQSTGWCASPPPAPVMGCWVVTFLVLGRLLLQAEYLELLFGLEAS